MAATPQEIATGAACIDACIPPGMQQSALIYVLLQIQGGTLTTQQLIDGAACIDACIPAGSRSSVAIYLLAQIASGA